jgi:hypothetical protein
VGGRFIDDPATATHRAVTPDVCPEEPMPYLLSESDRKAIEAAVTKEIEARVAAATAALIAERDQLRLRVEALEQDLAHLRRRLVDLADATGAELDSDRR